jgi:predicted ATP-dependent endonuclease of OLD family
MLTQLTVRNFKLFGEVAVELADRVVLIGPNNSGKTSALQALALWTSASNGGWKSAALETSLGNGQASPLTART